MSKFIRTAVLTFLIATPTFFLTALACLRVGVIRRWHRRRALGDLA